MSQADEAVIELEPARTDAQLRQAFGCFPSGVTAICSVEGGVPTGMAVSSFTPVSLDPPLVSVCIQRSSTTWPVLRESARIGLSVLAEGQEAVSTRLAMKTGDRFDGTPWSILNGAGVVIPGAALWLDCSIFGEVDAGDHEIILLYVHGVRADPTAKPLVFHGSRYRNLADA